MTKYLLKHEGDYFVYIQAIINLPKLGKFKNHVRCEKHETQKEFEDIYDGISD